MWKEIDKGCKYQEVGVIGGHLGGWLSHAIMQMEKLRLGEMK